MGYLSSHVLGRFNENHKLLLGIHYRFGNFGLGQPRGVVSFYNLSLGQTKHGGNLYPSPCGHFGRSIWLRLIQKAVSLQTDIYHCNSSSSHILAKGIFMFRTLNFNSI